MYPDLRDSEYQQSGWETDNSQAKFMMGPLAQFANQSQQNNQTYNTQQFPKSISQEKKYQGTSGWDAFMNLTGQLGKNVQQNQSNNPYSQWDNSNPQYGNNYPQDRKGGQQSQSLWDNISIDKNLSFIMNPIFNKQPPKYEFPSPFMRYKIIPYMDQKMALDVTSVNNDSKKLKKNNMIIWDYHGGPNQLFYLKKKNNGKFYIINCSKGFTLQIPDSSSKDGINVYANPRNDTQNQFWDLVPGRKQGTYQIISFCGKALDCENQSTKNGTRVIQWSKNDGKNQLWKIVPA